MNELQKQQEQEIQKLQALLREGLELMDNEPWTGTWKRMRRWYRRCWRDCVHEYFAQRSLSPYSVGNTQPNQLAEVTHV